MPAYSGYLVIKSLLVVLVWQIHCFPTQPLGKIICVSDQSGRTGAKLKDALYLTTNEVKAKVIETYSESDLRHFLERIPQFYQYKSTVFTNMAQKNAMKDDYILMKNQLQSIKDQFQSNPESISRTDFDEVSETIEKLEAFQKLIQKGIQDKIYKMKNHIKDIEILGIQENCSLKKKAKMASPSSETVVTKELSLDLIEQISERVWDAQVDKLSGILHGLPLHRDDNQKIIKKGNELSLELQNILFQQVGYMYKQKMISGEAFKKFCQSKTTLEIAAFAMIHNNPWRDSFSILNPLTVLNEWTCENYRKIYEVLDENNKRYFFYMSLKAYDYTFNWIGNFNIKSLFEEDKLFHILEKLVSPPSRKSDSSINLQELRNQDPDYVQIKHFLQESIEKFKNNQVDLLENVYRERSFLFLYFIQNHYDLEIFELEKGEKFEEKMSLMTSSLQLVRELRNIYWYVKEGEYTREDISAIKKNKYGEEILMIYKLSNYLISKHPRFFSSSEMSIYCRTNWLNSLEELIEKSITQIIDQNKYYFHDQSSVLTPGDHLCNFQGSAMIHFFYRKFQKLFGMFT